MTKHFAEALIEAQGRSEFIIVVVADIRGFSTFSTVNESPNIAMFIKRFYLKLINEYFSTANFVKPTGDGLLLTFPYSETNLMEVSKTVIASCMSCLNDFPHLCNDDPMINFPVPQAIGFGVARGTACCLYSANEILDYSGHLLNLASRLNDLARPSGIVIDGNYLKSVLPESFSELFKEQQVYIRSIAEDSPVDVLYLENYVQIPDSALTPLINENWQTFYLELTIKQIEQIKKFLYLDLPAPAKSKDKLKATLILPGTRLNRIPRFLTLTCFKYEENGPRARITVDIKKLKARIRNQDLKSNTKMNLKIEYVPKSLTRT